MRQTLFDCNIFLGVHFSSESSRLIDVGISLSYVLKTSGYNFPLSCIFLNPWRFLPSTSWGLGHRIRRSEAYLWWQSQITMPQFPFWDISFSWGPFLLWMWSVIHWLILMSIHVSSFMKKSLYSYIQYDLYALLCTSPSCLRRITIILPSGPRGNIFPEKCLKNNTNPWCIQMSTLKLLGLQFGLCRSGDKRHADFNFLHFRWFI